MVLEKHFSAGQHAPLSFWRNRFLDSYQVYLEASKNRPKQYKLGDDLLSVGESLIRGAW